MNFGREFSNPVQSIFNNAGPTWLKIVGDDLIEVTLVVKLPNLRNTEECDQFIKKIWNFSRKFGEMLV